MVTVSSLVADSAESLISTSTSISGSVSPPPVPCSLTVNVMSELSASFTLAGEADMEAVGASTASLSLTDIVTLEGVPTEYPVPDCIVISINGSRSS